jgi:hypothetical protein
MLKAQDGVLRYSGILPREIMPKLTSLSWAPKDISIESIGSTLTALL